VNIGRLSFVFEQEEKDFGIYKILIAAIHDEVLSLAGRGVGIRGMKNLLFRVVYFFM